MIKLTNLLALLAVTSGLIFLNGCKKDKDDDEQPEVKSYRMKSMTYTDDGDTYQSVLTYNADNRIIKITETENGVEFYRNEWAWNGNQVVITDSYMGNDGVWVGEDAYQRITYSNSFVSKSEHFLNDTMSYTTNYTWNGTLLTKEIQDYYSNNVKFWSITIDYIYEDNLLTTANFTTAGLLMQKEVIEYENGKPVRVKVYDSENLLQESSELLYTGEKVSQINSFHIVQGTQGEVDCSETRSYDSFGLVNSLSSQCDGDATVYTTQIVNEEGKGNLNDLILTNISWISAYLFPGTYPSELIAKKKKK